MKIDLHLHSHYSGDGIHNIGLLTSFFSKDDIVALTDHETIGGWEEFKFESTKRKLKPIFGIEWFANGCHLLSYFPNSDVPQSFREFISERRFREKTTMKYVADLYKTEFELFPSYEELMKMKTHPEQTLSMLVLGCRLRKFKGIEFKDAIDEIRTKKHFCPDCPEIYPTEVLIQKMSDWGAVNILAHPFRRKDCDDKSIQFFYKLVVNYKNVGLNGIELHPHEDVLNEKIISICKRLDLIWTIGSDYHCFKAGVYPSELHYRDDDILKGLRKLKLT